MIYFVTPEYLKSNTTVNQNVDVNDVVPLVKVAAEFVVKIEIGSYFFNDLLTKFNNQTLNGAEEILVQEYIKPLIAWKAAAEAVINTSYQIKNKGVQTQNGEFSSSPEMKAIMWLFHHYNDKVSFYSQRMVEFLSKNWEDYPELFSPLNKDTRIKKWDCGGINQYQGGILFI